MRLDLLRPLLEGNRVLLFVRRAGLAQPQGAVFFFPLRAIFGVVDRDLGARLVPPRDVEPQAGERGVDTLDRVQRRAGLGWEWGTHGQRLS